jgi:hypothetical protein
VPRSKIKTIKITERCAGGDGAGQNDQSTSILRAALFSRRHQLSTLRLP